MLQFDDALDTSNPAVSTNLNDRQAVASVRPVSEPLYFPSGERRLFGWLHTRSGGPPASTGLVICKPFGFEAVSAHLSITAFAESAADLGIPALRFDYSGAGDSEDLPPAADQWDAWLLDILAAIEELRRRAGVDRICLLGFRLGATLATLVAARSPHVRALIAVAPIINGRRYLRELRTFELAAAMSTHAAEAAQMPSREADLAGAGHMEVSGFFLNARTIAALQPVDLLTLPAPPISDALLIDRDDLPGAQTWGELLSRVGIRTQYRALPGFVSMMMRAPNLTEIPHAMIGAVHQWLGQNFVGSAVQTADLSPRAAEPEPALYLRDDSAATLTEKPAVLRSDPLLFGIVTLPRQGEIRRRGVILLNSGGDHHIGPRRLYVSLAREWAQRGYVVLRMDLSGLGDSAPQSGKPVNVMFPSSAIDDIRIAVDIMRTRYNVRDVTLAGVCSGASHAARAAMNGIAVDRLLLINPLLFFWKDNVNVADVQPWEVVHKPGAYLSQAMSLAAWRRLLFGDVSIWRVARIYFSRPLLAMQSALRYLARGLRIPLEEDLRRELDALKSRGVRIVFAFSRGDAGMRLLRLQTGLSEEKLGERYCLRAVDGADHDFTRSGARSALSRALSEELYARHADAASQQAPVAPLGSGLPRVGAVVPPPKHR
jgi:alpha-beta hydrolase superfamily lysophospholipase